MKKFFEAAKRDASGILRLYFYLFFMRAWYRPQGGIGERVLHRVFPWAMGALVPYGVFSAIAYAFAQDGVIAGVGGTLVLLFFLWAAYRIYRIFKPEDVSTGTEHLRGAEINDLSHHDGA